MVPEENTFEQYVANPREEGEVRVRRRRNAPPKQGRAPNDSTELPDSDFELELRSTLA